MSHFGELPDVVLLKIAQKSQKNSKMIKIWRFLWKATSGSTKIRYFRFLSNFWLKIAQKRQKNGSSGFRHYQMWISQKLPKLDYFTVIFGVFEQFLVKPHLPGSSPKQDNLDLWQKHACLQFTCTWYSTKSNNDFFPTWTFKILTKALLVMLAISSTYVHT